MTNNGFRDTRLFEALDYIDERFIAEITDKYEIISIPGEYRPNKKRLYKAYAVALARVACVLIAAGIITMALPMLFEHIGSGGTVVQTDPPSPSTQIDPERYTLTEEDLAKLNEYWLKTDGMIFAETVADAEARGDFCGKYGDCIIISPTSGYTAVSGFLVGNYRVNTGLTAGLRVIQDYKESHTLFYAYEYGVITDADMDMLYNYIAEHGQIRGVSLTPITERDYLSATSAPIELNIEELSNIIHGYFKMIASEPSNWNMDKYSIYCYGKFGNVYAVTVDALNTYGENEYSETVNGIEFKSPNSLPLRIYFDGYMYTITEAAEKGIIGKKDLETLARDFNEQVPLYPDKFSNFIYGHMEPDRIIVSLMPYTDISKYTPKDFSEIGCTEIERLPANETSDKRLLLTIAPRTLEEIRNIAEDLLLRSDVYRVDGNPREYTLCQTSVPYELSDNDIEYIIEEYIDPMKRENADHYTVRCFGEYGERGNAYAVFIDHSDQPNIYYSNTKYVEKVIGSYTFKIPENEELYIYSGGNLFTLAEAYDIGIMRSVDIRDLYEYYETHKHLYPRRIYDIIDTDSITEKGILITLMSYTDPDDYTAESFSEINCIEIKKIADTAEAGMEIELILSYNSKEALAEAVKKLYERPDIYSARADYVLYVDKFG